MVERYGNPALLDDGLKVFTTMDSEKQRAAQEAMLGRAARGRQAAGLPRAGDDPGHARAAEGLHRAQREGARGRRDREQPATTSRWSPRVDDTARVDVQVGAHKGVLPLLGMRWARKVNPEAYYPAPMLTSREEGGEAGRRHRGARGRRRRT